MTWTDILAEIRRSVKEPTTGGHWTDAEYLRRANIVQKEVCRYTHCLEKTTSVTSTSGTSSYTKPSGCIRLKRVSYSNVWLPGTKREQLDYLVMITYISSPWTSSTGTPTNFIDDNNNYILYPYPDTTGDTIGLVYDAVATDLAAGTDEPFEGRDELDDFHDLIISGVLARVFLEDEKIEMSREWKSEYKTRRELLKKEMFNRENSLAQFTLIRDRVPSNTNPLTILDS